MIKINDSKHHGKEVDRTKGATPLESEDKSLESEFEEGIDTSRQLNKKKK